MADQSGKETSDDLIPHDMSPNKITRDSMFFNGRFIIGNDKNDYVRMYVVELRCSSVMGSCGRCDGACGVVYAFLSLEGGGKAKGRAISRVLVTAI